MKRKHLVAIGVSIAILLLLYWLLVAEDMNGFFVTFLRSCADKNVSSQKIISS